MSAAWGRQGVKKAPSSCVRSIWDEPSKTKAFTYTAHRVWNTPRYHFVCCTGQPLPAYIHTQPRNVGKTAMHYWKAGSAPLFTQAARRGERFAPDCCPCIRWVALWERVLQRIMSCSSHLPNDCPYFSAGFTNCQYPWNTPRNSWSPPEWRCRARERRQSALLWACRPARKADKGSLHGQAAP